MSQPSHPYELDLPIGFAADDGEVHRRAAIRKMRGHEEAMLYDRALAPGELVSHILAGTLLRLGSLELPGAGVAARLYTADRNHLLLQVRRITLGDELSASYTCPRCMAEVRTLEHLDGVAVRPLTDGEDPETINVELEDGYVDRRGNEHRDVVLRLPRGTDEASVAPLLERDPVKAADALALRCIRSIGTLPLAEFQAYGLRIMRDLTMGDRLRIHRALDEEAPGPRLRTNVRCDACRTRFERLLDVSDFFVPCSAGGDDSAKRSSTSPITSTGPGARS